MKPRFPLCAKILLWFFLNLVLVLAAAWLVVDAQVRSGLDSFLAGYVGQRVEGAARRLLDDLAASPESEWDALLERHRQMHGVQFVLMAGSERLAGPELELPEAVRQRLPRGGPGRGPPGGGRPPRTAGDESAPAARPPGGAGERGKRLEPRPLPIHERFFIRTEEPRAYWAGLLMAMRRGEDGGPRPATLLMRSDTFSAGGFFFDCTPWVLGAGGLVLMSALLWLPLVRNLTRAIYHMHAATARIADGQFDVAVDDTRADELGQLGSAINRMAGRLHGFVKGQKRFLGDAAHELCSPLARLQMALGILEQRADEKQKPYLEDAREEVQHMSDLVNELLSFSKASLRPSDIKLEPVNVRAVAERAVRREAAGGGEVLITVPEDIFVLATPELLQRALANLVRNALRYAGHAGPVSVSAKFKGGRVRISVADRGPGIPSEQLQHVFETFYRLDISRSRESGGVGLGLAIVRTCAESCGGTVVARNRKDGGLRVFLELKAARASSEAPPSSEADESM